MMIEWPCKVFSAVERKAEFLLPFQRNSPNEHFLAGSEIHTHTHLHTHAHTHTKHMKTFARLAAADRRRPPSCYPTTSFLTHKR